MPPCRSPTVAISLRSTPMVTSVCAISGERPVTMTVAPSSRDASTVWTDRKSTRLNSSHLVISYAVFCLKKKKDTKKNLHYLYHSLTTHHNTRLRSDDD